MNKKHLAKFWSTPGTVYEITIGENMWALPLETLKARILATGKHYAQPGDYYCSEQGRKDCQDAERLARLLKKDAKKDCVFVSIETVFAKDVSLSVIKERISKLGIVAKITKR